MNSRAIERFGQCYQALPPAIQRAADETYAMCRRNPHHRSLRFKRIRDNLWSVRITAGYRPLAARDGDTWLWFWIGTHDEYERLLKS